ncbi:unnamed protein product, partial [Vitis vinifera]
ERGVDPADLISFLLELSFHVTGEAYNINTLTEFQRNTIKDLVDLGLVKLQQGRKESWFIPTKLATNLSMSLSDTSSRKQGFVVVETNFRLYAYSSSKLHCEILRLFSRYASMLFDCLLCICYSSQKGTLLDVSLIMYECLRTFSLGKIIFWFFSSVSTVATPCHGYLVIFTISCLAEKIPCLQFTNMSQIRLWETDLNRVETMPSHLYDEFPSRDVFEAACDFAREYGGLLWEDSKKMRLVVKAEIHLHMREYLRRPK